MNRITPYCRTTCGWNCQLPGHRVSNCPEIKKIFCSFCLRKGTTTLACKCRQPGPSNAKPPTYHRINPPIRYNDIKKYPVCPMGNNVRIYPIGVFIGDEELLKLFLEQFGIKSCILNSELPTSIRCHVISQFNQGKYDIIIASDEKMLDDAAGGSSKKDKESGVSRGIDFQSGRTARGTNKGSVLSFVSIKEQPMNAKVEERLKAGYSSEETIIRNYQFKMEEVEAFRYRAHDAWRAITKVAVHEARLKEIKQEIFNSEKLKGFFNDNSRELEVLRHDKPLKTVKVQQHLSTVPDYIVPNSLKRIANSTNKRTRSTQFKKYSLAKAAFESQMKDPLS
uniref:RNA helicase n=1 Tax=Megaselia scalaris TaxID=36166 RepID=T1GAA2_MEGSC